jgi:hypothetical protein
VSEYEYMKIGINKAIVLCLFLAGCQNVKQESTARVQEYPLGIAILGPYKPDQFRELKETIWFKQPVYVDTTDIFINEDKFYILELTNLSPDTIFIAIDLVGEINCRYFCFYYIDGKHLFPWQGIPITCYLEERDAIVPNTSRRYLTRFYLDEHYCPQVYLSLDIISAFFDSLNLHNPIQYYFQTATPIRRNHPAFLFDIVDERFVPAVPIDIQKELDKTEVMLKKKNKRQGGN